MIKFHILGRTTLRKADGDLDSSFQKGPKRMALLIYLLLARPRGFHRRDELVALFWPEMGQKSARNALSNMLYHIREALGKYVLTSRGTEEIRIDREKIWCDAVAFEKALDTDASEKALELYHGDLLPGFHVTDISNEFQSWLDGQRERLRKRAFEAARMLSEKAELHNDWATARRWAKKAAALKPFSEEAQSRLITILKQVGDRAGALQAYEAFEERLQTEWEMEPSDKLKALVENIDVHANAKRNKSSRSATDRESKPLVAAESDRSQPDGGFSSQLQMKRRWWPAPALLLIIILVGWMLWPEGPNQDATTPAIAERSVAVLPFTYLGAEDSTDYFSLGMTEEILTRLAQVEDLSVISRTSVMQYTNTEKNLQEIARELGVAAIVEGSVQQEGDQVRITAQLIDARTDHHLWSKSYNRNFENILAMQSEVASNIAQALQTELLPQEEQQLTTYQDVDETAYHLYLRGQHLMNILEPEGIVKAPAFFEEAITLDSTFAPAYGGLAMASIWSSLVNRIDPEVIEVDGIPTEEAFPSALQAANQALVLDSTIVEAYLAQAIVYEFQSKDWERSGKAFQKAVSLNPNHSEARYEYGWHLLRQGRIESALDQMKRAVEVDPLSWSAHHGLGYALYCNRQYEDAIQQLTTALNLGSLYPNTKKYISTARFKLSQQFFYEGQDTEAEALIEDATSLLEEMWGPNTGWREPLQLAIKGRETETIERLNRTELPFPPRLYMTLLVGQKEKALDLIEQGINFEQRVFIDPIFDPVRDDPRFEQMVGRKLGIEVDVH